MVLRKKEDTWTRKESTISHFLQNSLWQRQWTCGKRDYLTNKIHIRRMMTIGYNNTIDYNNNFYSRVNRKPYRWFHGSEKETSMLLEWNLLPNTLETKIWHGHKLRAVDFNCFRFTGNAAVMARLFFWETVPCVSYHELLCSFLVYVTDP